MSINFHEEKLTKTYTTRTADQEWKRLIIDNISLNKMNNAVDIGCGGGIYSKALVDIGFNHVIGIDFSKAMLEGAKENCKDYSNINFQLGNAFESGLGGNSCDLVLERALIHHIDDLNKCVKEAYRLLTEDGTYIVQDRTPDDCFLKGSDPHIRGYFFELFPRLKELETKRRFTSEEVISKLANQGFRNIKELKIWEKRKIYNQKIDLLEDLKSRTGRSILFELSDSELGELINYIDNKVMIKNKIIEKDRWTIWIAQK